MFRQHFRRELRSGRFVIEFALSAPAGLEQVKAIPDPSLILILSDINMPGMTGLEMLPKVKAERPNVPCHHDLPPMGTVRPERGPPNSEQPGCSQSPSTLACYAKK